MTNERWREKGNPPPPHHNGGPRLVDSNGKTVLEGVVVALGITGTGAGLIYLNRENIGTADLETLQADIEAFFGMLKDLYF
ncbi:MAG: hypothetical protein ACE5F4_01705 [Candidatus Paceibacteria bacterium]